MTNPIPIRAPGAIALGTLFALGTVYVLFSDLKSPAQITVDHVMTLLVLIGTIASGHMFWHQARAFHVLPAFGLATLFLAGTFYCVTTSAARNAEVAVAKVGEVAGANEARQRLEADLTEAKDDLRRQRESQTRECATGDGPRCKGRSKLAEMAASHVLMLEARLVQMKPRQVANAGIKHAAKVFAALPGVAVGEAVIERSLVLFAPFLKALFLEIATIVFLGIGLSHTRKLDGRGANDNLSAPRVDDCLMDRVRAKLWGTTTETVKPGAEPVVEPEAIEHWVIQFRECYGRNPQIPEIQARFHGLSKTTAWRRSKAGLEPVVKPSGTRAPKVEPKMEPDRTDVRSGGAVVRLSTRRRLGRGISDRRPVAGCQ